MPGPAKPGRAGPSHGAYDDATFGIECQLPESYAPTLTLCPMHLFYLHKLKAAKQPIAPAPDELCPKHLCFLHNPSIVS